MSTVSYIVREVFIDGSGITKVYEKTVDLTADGFQLATSAV